MTEVIHPTTSSSHAALPSPSHTGADTAGAWTAATPLATEFAVPDGSPRNVTVHDDS
jgi:hypothetical protein